MIDYEGRTFRPVSVTANGSVSGETVFVYRQRRSIVTSSYQGGEIVAGHLIGLADEDGNLDFRYHQLTTDGELQSGTCQSRPEVLADGRIRLHETWRWTTGDGSMGTSIVEEVAQPGAFVQPLFDEVNPVETLGHFGQNETVLDPAGPSTDNDQV